MYHDNLHIERLMAEMERFTHWAEKENDTGTEMDTVYPMNTLGKISSSDWTYSDHFILSLVYNNGLWEIDIWKHGAKLSSFIK